MAYIKHFYRKEPVYEKCNDRGVEWYDWFDKDVEHYACSKCGAEVSCGSKFCSHCGEKLSGVREEYKKTACEICDTKFEQLAHERETCCSRCRRLVKGQYDVKIAKVFYELGKQANKA